MDNYEIYTNNNLFCPVINSIDNIPYNSILPLPFSLLPNNSHEMFDDLCSSYNEKNQEYPFIWQIIKGEKSTGVTDINIQKPKESNEKYDDYILQTYNLDEIIHKLSDDNFKKLIEEGKKDQKLKKAENDIQIINKKRKRDSNLNNQINNSKYDKGRKNKNDSTERKHDKFSSDNIIKKIKIKFVLLNKIYSIFIF